MTIAAYIDSSSRSRRHRTNRAGGVVMIEVLVVLVLMGVVVATAGRLFVVSIRAIREAPHGQNQIYHLGHMLDMLRRDVWTASEIEPAGDNAWRLRDGDATPAIIWTFATDGAVTRSDDAGLMTWRADRPMRAARDGAGLLLADGRIELLVPSQFMLAKGKMP